MVIGLGWVTNPFWEGRAIVGGVFCPQRRFLVLVVCDKFVGPILIVFLRFFIKSNVGIKVRPRFSSEIWAGVGMKFLAKLITVLGPSSLLRLMGLNSLGVSPNDEVWLYQCHESNVPNAFPH